MSTDQQPHDRPALPLPSWEDDYPDPGRLRHEVEAMAVAYELALAETLPAGAVIGLYRKGSAVKAWDSPIDYVPEVSDVDLHVLFTETQVGALDALEPALAVQRRAEAHFAALAPEALHLPRPQLVNANRLFADPAFVPTPTPAVTVRFGPPYPTFPEDATSVQERDLARLREGGELALGETAVDKPGWHLFSALRAVSWRVSPTASRVASVLSGECARAWGSNRTALVGWLVELGEEALATAYVAYYQACWRYFLAGFGDPEAGREALAAAGEVLTLGADVARRVSDPPDSAP